MPKQQHPLDDLHTVFVRIKFGFHSTFMLSFFSHHALKKWFLRTSGPAFFAILTTSALIAQEVQPEISEKSNNTPKQESPPNPAKSLVKINTTSSVPNFRIPWTPGTLQSGIGAGFVVAGNRIMTNAHVISRATFISVEREGDPRRYPARVQFVAHDSDLALLTVDEPRFFDGMTPLEFGDVPQLESTVFAYGFPLGGERMSVTRGVVSRIDFQTYSHTGIDAHLAVQIDAAINPGNSGGPVTQDGRVVGVAFQGYSGDLAQNVGYMIPTPVISRFLRDIEDGSYDHYVDLALFYSDLRNTAKRTALGLPDNGIGVFVYDVLAQGSADGHVKKGDVILQIDGFPVEANGFVRFDGTWVEMPEIVERKLQGEPISLIILREGKRIDVTFPLKRIWPAQINANQYESEPAFVLFGGLLFQPLSRGLMEAYDFKSVRLRYFYERFVPDQLYVERPEIVVLSNVLPDASNTYLSNLPPLIVDKVNGKTILTLEDLAKSLDKESGQLVIEFIGSGRPIILERTTVEAARKRILQAYGVSLERRIVPLKTD